MAPVDGHRAFFADLDDAAPDPNSPAVSDTSEQLSQGARYVSSGSPRAA
jgi:hypothetical protein